MGVASREIARAHEMIVQLGDKLGSLDHLCFAFPQVKGAHSQSFEDPSPFIAGAIARSRNPPPGTVKSEVDHKHHLPSTYLELDGISDVEIELPSNNAKKLLKRKNCLVIEKWGNDFVCRVPNEIRDGIEQETIAVVGIPPSGRDWNYPIIKKLRDVAVQFPRKEARDEPSCITFQWGSSGHADSVSLEEIPLPVGLV